jgi:BioD-like phosphotransacetylase family protein
MNEVRRQWMSASCFRLLEEERAMEKLVIASVEKGAGKTSLIIGVAKALKKPFGYLKPLGDRMVYREKKVWDYDAELITSLFGMKEYPEDMTIGFEHSKLRYMYDEGGRKRKLDEMVSHAGKELLFVEGAENLRYGISLGMDPLSLARDIGGKVLVLINGQGDVLLDDTLFVKDYLDMTHVPFKGVIFNNVQNPEDFETVYLREIAKRGIPVLGILPYEKELTYVTADFLAKRLFAKVVTGEKGLKRVVKNILVGAMSINALYQTPLFKQEGKLVITPGDRADMILAAIESDAACLVITNNILPSSSIISKADERNIPLLMVPHDTYRVATQIDAIESLIAKEDATKVDLLEQLVRKYVNLKEIAGEGG